MSYQGVAQTVNDTIRTNETSLSFLEEQIDKLTDALVSANADPIELQGMHEEEQDKLKLEIAEKSKLLNETLEQLKVNDTEHQKDLDLLQVKGRIERDSLVEQLRTSQMELMEHYTRVDTLENDTERLEWELSRAEDKYKLQNENLIEQNNALMHALQDEQNQSRDVIEDLERSLQRVTLNDDFEKDLEIVTADNFNPNSGSSPIKENVPSKTALEVLRKLKTQIKDLGFKSDELMQVIDGLEKAIIRESALFKRLQKRYMDLKEELEEVKKERPTKNQLKDVQGELEDTTNQLATSKYKIQELEKVLYTTLAKNETVLAELNKTIDSQDKQIEELKKKNFYPKLMNDLKKENARLREEVNKLTSLVKDFPNRKVGNLRNKFENQDSTSPDNKKSSEEEQKKVLERADVIHREEVNHLKSKLLILEKKLSQSIEENALLNQELNDAIDQLDENSFNYDNVLIDLQSKLDSSAINNTELKVEEEVAELKQHLESEKERNEDLSKRISEFEKSKSSDFPLPPPPSPPHQAVKTTETIPTSTPHTEGKSPPLPFSPKPNSLRIMSEKITSLKKENGEKEEALNSAEKRVNDLQADIKNFKETIEAQQDDIVRLKREVKRGVTVSVTPLPYREMGQLEVELEDSLQDKVHLEQTIDILTSEHEAQLVTLKAEIESLRSNSGVVMNDSDDVALVEQLEHEREIKITLESRIEELEFELSENNAGKDSEDSLNNLKENLDEAEKMCEQLMTEKIMEKQGNLDLANEKDKVIAQLNGEKEALQMEIEHLNTEFADISTEIAEADNQYCQRIENLQKQIENNNEDHEIVVDNLQEEIENLKKILEIEKNCEHLEKLENENTYLGEECKLLTDKLASDILLKISPTDEKTDIIEEMKSHFQKGHDRLKTEIELKKQKVEDLQEDLCRMNSNYARKIASLKEEHNIKEEHNKLKIEEHLLTNESSKKELEQLKKIAKRYEENLDGKRDEFNEVVTKLLNLENLIEIQQDNLLAKDEQIAAINRQLGNLKAELDIAQQRQYILREESLTLDVLENSLNEVSENDRRQEEKICNLENKLKHTLSDYSRVDENRIHLRAELAGKESELAKLRRTVKEVELNKEQIADALEEKSNTVMSLKKKVEDLEIQNEDLQDQEEIVSHQVNALYRDKRELESELQIIKRKAEPNVSSQAQDNVIHELKSSLTSKEKAIEEKTNEINSILNKQDKTKHELVSKNIELERKYDLLMDKFCDLEEEKSALLEDIDTNFNGHTELIRQLDSDIKELKRAVSDKDEFILEKDEELNKNNAKNLADSQKYFDTRKEMEKAMTDLKTRLMDYEGGDAVRRSSSVHSIWLEDTASLNHVIGEKDRQIRDLRDSLKRSSLAGSLKGSCIDINFNRSGSMSSIPPPSELGIEDDSLPEETFAIEEYKKKIKHLGNLMDKKDGEYNKLFEKFKGELDNQNRDSNVYNDHVKKLQKMASLFEQQADKLARNSKIIIEKSSKGINDVNESLSNLNDELQIESERTNEVLSELDLLKEEIDAIQQTFMQNQSSNDDNKLSDTLNKVLTIQDNVAMTIEEHQYSLDHYQLLFQTAQQEIQMIDEELKSIPLHETAAECYLSEILNIVQEKVDMVSEKLSETKDDVTSSRFRGSQNGKTEKENEAVIEQAELRCRKYETEIDSIKKMLGACNHSPDSENFMKITDELQELTGEMGDLKDLLSLKKSTSLIAKPRQRVHGLDSEEYDALNSNTSVLERSVALQEIDGLELITHDLRHQLREKTKECQELKDENLNMNQGMKELQTVFGQMLSAKTVELDTLNDTINSEKHVLETQLCQLSDVIEYKDKSQDHLRKSLSFEQGRVQQLKEDLDTTYEKTFEHIKEYEGRVSTITERLNLQQQQIKSKMDTYEEEIAELKERVKQQRQFLKEKDSVIEDVENSHKKELRTKQRALRRAQDESMRYYGELEDHKRSISQSHGSFDEQLSQYSDIMTKFRNEISEEKEAFQNSLQKLNYLVEDRTCKIKEYEKMVQELQNSLYTSQQELQDKGNLNDTLMKERSKLKTALVNQQSLSENDKDKTLEISTLRNKASKAEQSMKQMKSTVEDIKYRYEVQLSNKADEVLKARMKLEKVEIDLRNRSEENDDIRNEVKALKLEIEDTGSDNQVKDLEQKLAGKQSDVEEAVFRMQRYQRETEALKDVLASYQNSADNDVAHKISEYETTVADYEVQVTMLKKNISDIHTQLHNTYDERQKVVEKAQGQLAVYQRRLEQMSDRAEEAKIAAKKDADSFKDSRRSYQSQILALQHLLDDTNKGGEHYALRQKIASLERQLSSTDRTTDRDIQQRFELAVKRADHLQEQVDGMRKTNKRMQKTIEDLWTENTQLLKDINKHPKNEDLVDSTGGLKDIPTKFLATRTDYYGKTLSDSAPNVIGSGDI